MLSKFKIVLKNQICEIDHVLNQNMFEICKHSILLSLGQNGTEKDRIREILPDSIDWWMVD